MKKLKISIISMLVSTSFMFAQGYKIGDTISGFSLKNVDEKTVSTDSFKDNKGLVVVFTCNHCPFSKMYESRIKDLHTKYAAKGFPVLAINSNDEKSQPEDSFENMKVYAKKGNYTFPYLYDDSQNVAKAFGAQRTPHVFLLKKSEKGYTLEFIGAIDDNAQESNNVKEKYVEKAIEELLSGKEVSTKSVKAIGCTIKWKI